MGEESPLARCGGRMSRSRLSLSYRDASGVPDTGNERSTAEQRCHVASMTGRSLTQMATSRQRTLGAAR